MTSAHFIGTVLPILLLCIISSGKAIDDLTDFHQFDCHQCSASGRLNIGHIFQIDEQAFVQLQPPTKEQQHDTPVYHVIDLSTNKSEVGQHRVVSIKDFFHNGK